MKVNMFNDMEECAITSTVSEHIDGMWTQFLLTELEDSFTTVHGGDSFVCFKAA